MRSEFDNLIITGLIGLKLKSMFDQANITVLLRVSCVPTADSLSRPVAPFIRRLPSNSKGDTRPTPCSFHGSCTDRIGSIRSDRDQIDPSISLKRY